MIEDKKVSYMAPEKDEYGRYVFQIPDQFEVYARSLEMCLRNEIGEKEHV